jgi:hypothetical protein
VPAGIELPAYRRELRILTAEQLLLHLPHQRHAELRVGADVCEGLVEALGDHGQAAGGVEYVSGPLLHQ